MSPWICYTSFWSQLYRIPRVRSLNRHLGHAGIRTMSRSAAAAGRIQCFAAFFVSFGSFVRNRIE